MSQTDSLQDVETANDTRRQRAIELDLTLLESDSQELDTPATSVKTPIPPTRILVIDGQQTMGSGIAALLRDHPIPGLGVEVAHGRDEAVRMIAERTYAACVIEAGAIDRDPQLQREIAVHHSGPLMVATRHGAPGTASLDGLLIRELPLHLLGSMLPNYLAYAIETWPGAVGSIARVERAERKSLRAWSDRLIGGVGPSAAGNPWSH